MCSGAFNKPRYPSDIDIRDFTGRAIHSAMYKDPEQFAGCKTLLMIGCGSSARDIASELSANGYTVNVYHRATTPLFPVSGIREFNSPIQWIAEHTVCFHDNTSIEVDGIIIGTGFDSDHSFVDKTCRVTLEDETTPVPLYNYLVNSYYPTMALPGRVFFQTPFILSEYQAIYFRKILTGEVTVPDLASRLSEAEVALDQHRVPGKRTLYRLSNHVYSYYQRLDNIMGTHLINYELAHQLHGHCVNDRLVNPLGFRDDLSFYNDLTASPNESIWLD